MLNPNLIKRTLAAGLAIGTVGVPAAAQARLNLNPPSDVPAPVANAAPVAPSAQSGFQWGDAGLGAAGAIVLLGAGAAGTGTLRRWRTQRTALG